MAHDVKRDRFIAAVAILLLSWSMVAWAKPLQAHSSSLLSRLTKTGIPLRASKSPSMMASTVTFIFAGLRNRGRLSASKWGGKLGQSYYLRQESGLAKQINASAELFLRIGAASLVTPFAES